MADYYVKFTGSYYSKDNPYNGFSTVGEKTGCLFDDNAYAEYDRQYDRSIDLLNNVKLISDFKKWVSGGSKTMVYMGKEEKINETLLLKALDRYAWSMVVLSQRLLEQNLPVTFVDVDKFVREHSGLQINNLEGRYGVVGSFIASLANATSKNQAMLDRYSELKEDGTKYQSYEDYKLEMAPKTKK